MHTFSNFEAELIIAVAARVELAAIQQGTHVVHKHLVTSHGELIACSLLLHQLQVHREET